jgi:hypothetical protein
MKLTNEDYGPFWWVAHPEGGKEHPLVKRRYEIEIIGGVEDKDASYSYDDFALCELDGQFYLLETSGCSCPSPSETWGIDIGPATLAEIKAALLSDKVETWSVKRKQLPEFLALIQEAELKYGGKVS